MAKRKTKRKKNRPGGDFHGRLRQALGRDLKSTGRFRKVIELELTKGRDEKSVKASVNSLIEKLQRSPKFTPGIGSELLSALGQAVAGSQNSSVDKLRTAIRQEIGKGATAVDLGERFEFTIRQGDFGSTRNPEMAEDEIRGKVDQIIAEEILRKKLNDYSDDPELTAYITKAAQNALAKGIHPDDLGDSLETFLSHDEWMDELKGQIIEEFGEIDIPITVPAPAGTPKRMKVDPEIAAPQLERLLKGTTPETRLRAINLVMEHLRTHGPDRSINFANIVEQAKKEPDPRARGGFIMAGEEPKPRPEGKKPQEQTVEAYMSAMATIYAISKSPQMSPQRRQSAIYTWQALRDARVFHFDVDVYGAFHHEADRYTTSLAGQEWQMPGSGKTTPGEGRALRRVIWKESGRVPWPDKWPFPAVYVGFGEGAGIRLPFLQIRAPRDLQDRLVSGELLGYLMTEDGIGVAIISANIREDSGGLRNVTWFEEVHAEGGWIRSEFNLEPWVMPALINVINDHRTFILETPLNTGQRRDFRRRRKEMGLKNGNKRGYTPPPYYTLRMKTQLITEKIRKGVGRPGVPKSYRTDVRGHERCRIARGHLPLDPETGAKLHKRGYKIFTTNPLDADTLRRLSERGQPYKRADEWLAILTTWIESHMSSLDEKLPYIPACRLPGNVRARRRQPTNSWADDPGR